MPHLLTWPWSWPCGSRGCVGVWRSFAPGHRSADAAAMRETLQSLGYRGAFVDAEAEEWLTCHATSTSKGRS